MFFFFFFFLFFFFVFFFVVDVVVFFFPKSEIFLTIQRILKDSFRWSFVFSCEYEKGKCEHFDMHVAHFGECL